MVPGGPFPVFRAPTVGLFAPSPVETTIDRRGARPVHPLAGFQTLPLGHVTSSAANLTLLIGPLLAAVLAMLDMIVMLPMSGVGPRLAVVLALLDTIVVMLATGVGPLLAVVLAMLDTVVSMLPAMVGFRLVSLLVGLEPLPTLLQALVMIRLVPLGFLLAESLPSVLVLLALLGPQLAGLLPVLVYPLGAIPAVGELFVQTSSVPGVHPALESRDPLAVPGAETLGELIELGQTVRVVSLCGDLAEAPQFRHAVPILALSEPGFPLLGPGR